MNKKKVSGLLILLLVYIFATVVGVVSFNLINTNFDLLLKLFIADAIATVFVWVAGIFLKSASVYDPYWSVQTIVIYVALVIMYDAINLGTILLFICILFWAIRLTFNFAYGFNDISYVDWRYKMLKEKTGPFFQLVSLLGIHMFPTIVVFLASIPAFMYVINGCQFEFVNLIGLFIMFMATVTQAHTQVFFSKLETRNSLLIN